MRKTLIAFLIIYSIVILIINTLIVSTTTLDVALVNHIALLRLQGFSETATTLGISLLLTKFYINRLKDADLITLPRIAVCIGIVFVAFRVLLPVQQNVILNAANLSTAEMRREALVLSVTNFGLVTGDVSMPQLDIQKASLQSLPIQTLFPFLNPIFLLSDGYDLAERDLEPIAETIIYNGIARNEKLLSVSFNGAMKSSCAARRAFLARYQAASLLTVRDFRTSSDLERVRREWSAKMADLFGERVPVVPDLTEAELLAHPAVKQHLGEIVSDELESVEIPDFLSALGGAGEFAAYARLTIRQKIDNPCAMNWQTFVEDGLRDEVIEELVGYYARLAREDYHRLGPEGDFNGLGVNVMMYAVAPPLSLTLTWLVGSLQLITAFSMILRYYVPGRVSYRPALTLMFALFILYLPMARPSQAERSIPELETRFSIMQERYDVTGSITAILLKRMVRVEERIFPIGRALVTLTPLQAFDMFRGGALENDQGS